MNFILKIANRIMYWSGCYWGAKKLTTEKHECGRGIGIGPWVEFKGDYEKEEYDIKLKSGEIIGPCWPNAGTFHDLRNPENGLVIFGDVSYIRDAVHPSYDWK